MLSILFKQIFPRNLVDNMMPTHPEPDYLK